MKSSRTFTAQTITVAQNSVTKPWMWKPPTSRSVSFSISIETPNQISPSVRNASGSVSSRSSGLSTVFSTPKRSAARSRSPAESTVTPWSAPVTTASTSAFAAHDSRSCFASRITCDDQRRERRSANHPAGTTRAPTRHATLGRPRNQEEQRDRSELPVSRRRLDDAHLLRVGDLVLAPDHRLRGHLPPARPVRLGQGGLDDLRDRASLPGRADLHGLAEPGHDRADSGAAAAGEVRGGLVHPLGRPERPGRPDREGEGPARLRRDQPVRVRVDQAEGARDRLATML